MNEYKDLLQMGFSFFVAAYLLIVFNQQLSTLTRKIDELLSEIRHLCQIINITTPKKGGEGSPHPK